MTGTALCRTTALRSTYSTILYLIIYTIENLKCVIDLILSKLFLIMIIKNVFIICHLLLLQSIKYYENIFKGEFQGNYQITR